MIHPTCQDLQLRPEDLFLNRRQFLERAGMGFGALSLTGLVAAGLLDPLPAGAAPTSPLAPKQPHFPGMTDLLLLI